MNMLYYSFVSEDVVDERNFVSIIIITKLLFFIFCFLIFVFIFYGDIYLSKTNKYLLGFTFELIVL